LQQTNRLPAMRDLLKSKRYNSGPRPSEHHIGKRSFLKDNGGAIASNVLSVSNTSSNDAYQEHCRKKGLKPHPARMQRDVAAFFVKFLTREGDTVLDPFAGSNTTGAVAEILRRKWVSIEANRDYIRGSRGRFTKNSPR
jgi:site-specific DNA-methyltransferase (cytosine-N4-specific)